MASIGDAEWGTMQRERSSGVLFKDIGARYGVTGSAVAQWFRKKGLDRSAPRRETEHEHLGYIWRHIPGRGTIAVHRLVMEQIIGRPLARHEIVHHRDGNKQNNAPENLEIHSSISEHMKHHQPGARGLSCVTCGAAAFIVDGKRGNVPRCRRCFNHARRYHQTGACTSSRRRCPFMESATA